MHEPFFKVTRISDNYEYSNKMALEYHLCSYLCHFPSKIIFGYLFCKYVASEYICGYWFGKGNQATAELGANTDANHTCGNLF